MMKMGLLILALTTLFFPFPALARTPSPEGALVYIISPADGEGVLNPIIIKFGLQGMGVAPAGVDIKNTGHHHLLIDAKRFPPLDKPIPSDKHHKHFGKGQTETVLELSPGIHTLQLIFGDQSHIPFDPPLVSGTVTILVK